MGQCPSPLRHINTVWFCFLLQLTRAWGLWGPSWTNTIPSLWILKSERLRGVVSYLSWLNTQKQTKAAERWKREGVWQMGQKETTTEKETEGQRETETRIQRGSKWLAFPHHDELELWTEINLLLSISFKSVVPVRKKAIEPMGLKAAAKWALEDELGGEKWVGPSQLGSGGTIKHVTFSSSILSLPCSIMREGILCLSVSFCLPSPLSAVPVSYSSSILCTLLVTKWNVGLSDKHSTSWTTLHSSWPQLLCHWCLWHDTKHWK